MGRFDAALVMLDVLAAIADQPDLYWIRGQAHAGKGNHERAIADFDQVLSGSPNVGMVYIARGASYEAKGDLDKANRGLSENGAARSHGEGSK